MQIDPQPSVLSVEQWAYVRLLLAETIENSTWKNEHLRDGAAKLVKTICFEHMEYAAQRPPSPHSASQPDTVAVPIQTLHVSLQVLTFLKAVLIGQGYQKDSSSIHQLEIAYSMLRAAQEAK